MMDIKGFIMELWGEQWLAQWIGIAATLISFIGYFSKSSHRIFFFQILTNGIWAVHLTMIHAYPAAAMNVCGFVRSLFLFWGEEKPWARSLAAEIGITLLMAASGIGAWIIGGSSSYAWVPALPLVAMVVGTVLLWTRKDKVVRYTQFFIISPLWLVHNYLVVSVGGVLCELLNMLSVGIAILKYKKTET